MIYNFPLYVLRKYTSITREGNFLVIQTKRNKYVLDLLGTSEPSYAKRRLTLLTMTLPYLIYPFNIIVDSLGGLLSLKSSIMFMDSTGKLLKWTKKENKKIVCRRVVKYWEVPNGYMLVAEVTGLTYFIRASDYNLEQYMELLSSNNTETLLRVIASKDMARTRKKI